MDASEPYASQGVQSDRTVSRPSSVSGLRDVAASFGKLGLTSFGGPIGHLSYFRAEFVAKREWLDDEAYADLVALCQFLPGPASSQVAFALGMHRAGLLGALIASVCFTLPSALLLIAFAYSIATVRDLSKAGWLHGLKLAAVAVVAQAVWAMGKNLCPDRSRLTMCVIAAVLVLIMPGVFSQIGVLLGGALCGWWIYRKTVAPSNLKAERKTVHVHLLAGACLASFLLLLLTLPILARASSSIHVKMFDSFFRSGALVFGGGHVVLPLLRSETVPRGWVSDGAFLAGYGATQAVPGPLFTFAAYLGTVINPGPFAWANGLWCLLTIFLPAWLLVCGVLPSWQILRSKRWAQAGLRGANAAVVGILLAALYSPVITETVHGTRDVAAAMAAFASLQFRKIPPWAVVVAMAAVGHLSFSS